MTFITMSLKGRRIVGYTFSTRENAVRICRASTVFAVEYQGRFYGVCGADAQRLEKLGGKIINS